MMRAVHPRPQPLKFVASLPTTSSLITVPLDGGGTESV